MNTKQEVIALTPKAASYIQSLLAKEMDAKGLRLLVKQAGCSGKKYDKEITKQVYPGDHHQRWGDINIYIEPSSIRYLQGVTLDYLSEGLQTKLIFQHNEKASNVCGCGESFSVDDETE